MAVGPGQAPHAPPGIGSDRLGRAAGPQQLPGQVEHWGLIGGDHQNRLVAEAQLPGQGWPEGGEPELEQLGADGGQLFTRQLRQPPLLEQLAVAVGQLAHRLRLLCREALVGGDHRPVAPQMKGEDRTRPGSALRNREAYHPIRHRSALKILSVKVPQHLKRLHAQIVGTDPRMRVRQAWWLGKWQKEYFP